MDCFDSFLTGFGHVANLPEKNSKLSKIKEKFFKK